jgi:hypothetical protein
MKKSMLLVVVLLLVSSLAFAQYDPGSIDIYTDVSQSSCNFTDTGGLIEMYYYHTHTDGATASSFRVEFSEGAAWTHLGSTWNFATVIGSHDDGWDVAYGNCLGQNSDIYLGLSNFFGNSSPACGLISIVPGQGLSGLVEVIDCAIPAAKWTLDRGGQARVNNDGSCSCTVPVQETTWGGIKALYD